MSKKPTIVVEDFKSLIVPGLSSKYVKSFWKKRTENCRKHQWLFKNFYFYVFLLQERPTFSRQERPQICVRNKEKGVKFSKVTKS